MPICPLYAYFLVPHIRRVHEITIEVLLNGCIRCISRIMQYDIINRLISFNRYLASIPQAMEKTRLDNMLVEAVVVEADILAQIFVWISAIKPFIWSRLESELDIYRFNLLHLSLHISIVTYVYQSKRFEQGLLEHKWLIRIEGSQSLSTLGASDGLYVVALVPHGHLEPEELQGTVVHKVAFFILMLFLILPPPVITWILPSSRICRHTSFIFLAIISQLHDLKSVSGWYYLFNIFVLRVLGCC